MEQVIVLWTQWLIQYCYWHYYYYYLFTRTFLGWRNKLTISSTCHCQLLGARHTKEEVANAVVGHSVARQHKVLPTRCVACRDESCVQARDSAHPGCT